MKRFAALFADLDRTNRTQEKVALLERYFREAPPEDAAWALHVLAGRKLPRAVAAARLREWAGEESGYPGWLVEASYEAVGDLAETVALLLPEKSPGTDLPLHHLVESRLLVLPGLPVEAQRELLVRTWRELDSGQRLVWNKLITGSFRVGVARTLVVRALAAAAGVEPAIMAHRILGSWKATPEEYRRLWTADSGRVEPARPYPFFLASPLEGEPRELGPIGDWQLEWKWDGIRAQLIRRQGEVVIWSRGEEMMNGAFPELVEAGKGLTDGTVLDGEILAWEGKTPLSFGRLQRRLGRKRADAALRESVPVRFVAYDLLEWGGKDLRETPLRERRSRLEESIDLLGGRLPLGISPLVEAESWEEVLARQAESRDRGVEGIMMKRRESGYGVGRQRGDWWKWKVDPYLIDAVLMYAQSGHGRRASLYTDYTFGLWREGKLVPVAKAYSGLTDAEIAEVDQFIRRNTTEQFGPVRVVKPELVFELAFEGIQESTRHKSGLAMRFPRMHRWRRDKTAEEADSVEGLRALLGAEPS